MDSSFLNVVLTGFVAVLVLELLALIAYPANRAAAFLVVTFALFFGLAIAYYGAFWGIAPSHRFLFAAFFLSLVPASVLVIYLVEGIRVARTTIVGFIIGYIGLTLAWVLGLALAPVFGGSAQEVFTAREVAELAVFGVLAETAGLILIVPLYVSLGRRLRLPFWIRLSGALILAPLASGLVLAGAGIIAGGTVDFYIMLGAGLGARVGTGLLLTPPILLFLRFFSSPAATVTPSPRTRDVVSQLLETKEPSTGALAVYKTLFDIAAEAIFVLDSQGTIKQANVEAELGMGYPVGQLIGTKMWHILQDESDVHDAQGQFQARLRQVQSGQPARFEAFLKRANGSPMPADVSLTRIEGPPLAFLAIAHDLTEQKRHRDALGRQTAELDTLAELSHIAASAQSTEDLLKATADRVADLVHADACWITRVDGRLTRVTIAAASSVSPEEVKKLVPFSRDDAPSLTLLALETEHPVIIADYVQSPYFDPKIQLKPQPRALLALPLSAGGRKMGAVLVGHAALRTFSSDEVNALERVTNVVALSVAKMDLLEQTRERLNHALVLNGIAEALGPVLDAREVLQLLSRELMAALRMRAAWALERTEEGRSMTLVSSVLPDAALQGAQFTREDFPWIADPRYREDPLLVESVSSDDRLAAVRPLAEQRGVRSLLLVPLQAGSHVPGMLLLDATDRTLLSRSEWDLVRSVARYGMVALERAELFAQIEEQREVAESLRRIGVALTGTLDYDEILDRILHGVAEVVPCDAANIQLIQEGEARVIRSLGYEKAAPGTNAADLRLPIDKVPGLQEMIKTGAPSFVPDVEQDPTWYVPEGAPRLWLRSWAGAPITVRGDVIGFVNADSASFTYSQRHADLLALFANQAAVALENSLLYEQAQRRLKELAALYRASQGLQRLYAPETLAREVINALGEILGYDHGSVMLIEESTGLLRTFGLNEWGQDAAFREAELERVESFRIRVGQGITGWVAEHGESLNVPDVRRDERYLEVRPDIVSELCVPMRLGDEIIGVVNVESVKSNAYTDADRRLLETVAAQIAIAIQNARLYENLQRAYEQLKATQDEAMRSVRLQALGEMASGIAHDFNNVLTPILGYLELVSDHAGLPDDVRSDVERARRGALAASSIVARLREFYRPREPAEAFTPVDLNKAIAEALDLTRPRWRDIPQEHGIVIQIEAKLEQVPPVRGDANALRDLVTNLILNAVDAMPAGGIIALSTGVEDDKVLLRVSDNGVGMTEEVRRRLFEPFFSTKGTQGTGLGLAMCYGIVQRHGGTIEVQSQPGEGASFFVRLPLSAEAMPISTDAALPALPPLTILLVDDDAAVLGVVSRMLTRAGHKVFTASSGKDALERFQPRTVDVVITDLGMPGITGREVAQTVHERSPQTPVILLTGWGAKVGVEEGVPEEVTAVLSKPVQAAELHRALAQVMGLLDSGKPSP